MAEPGTIADLADRIDGYRQGEHELAVGAGTSARAGQVRPPERVLLAAISAHAAWRAELWAARRPDLPGIPPAALAPADHGIDLPAAMRALLARYEAHAARVDPAVDGPTWRTLQLVIADLRADLAQIASGTSDTSGGSRAR